MLLSFKSANISINVFKMYNDLISGESETTPSVKNHTSQNLMIDRKYCHSLNPESVRFLSLKSPGKHASSLMKAVLGGPFDRL